MLRKLVDQITAQTKAQKDAEANRDLIRKEAAIGGELFGDIPIGNHRQFFCLDEHTWVWHEEWMDYDHQTHTRTTRYLVRPSGVVKMVDGIGYQSISPSEALNLRNAAQLYYKRVMREVYQRPA